MTRTTNIKGMQAIIRSNVLKKLKRITETEKQNVTKFINSLSLEELKQKGLTKQIETQFKDGKPRKTLIGGMKRQRDQYPDKPIEQGRITKFFHGLMGKQKSNETHTINIRRDELNEKFQEERDLMQQYEIAKIRTRDAIQQEQLMLSKLKSKRLEISTEYQRAKSFLELNKHLIKNIPDEQEQLYEKYKSMDKPDKDYKNWEKNRNIIFDKMRVNDTLYYELTGKILNHHELFTSASSSSSSSSDDVMPLMIDSLPQQQEETSAIRMPDVPSSSSAVIVAPPRQQPPQREPVIILPEPPETREQREQRIQERAIELGLD